MEWLNVEFRFLHCSSNQFYPPKHNIFWWLMSLISLAIVSMNGEVSLNELGWKANTWLGFSLDGVFHKYYVAEDRTADIAWYSITDYRWPTVRKHFKFGWRQTISMSMNEKFENWKIFANRLNGELTTFLRLFGRIRCSFSSDLKCLWFLCYLRIDWKAKSKKQ